MVTRRQFNLLLASSAFAATFARDAFAQSAATPKPGGELQFAFDGADVVTFLLDPHATMFAPHNRVMRSIYDNLLELLPDQSVGPWLATSWDISADQKIYTFKLRTDVKFHDGTPFNAAAVKANIDRARDPKNALPSLRDLGPIVSTDVVADDTVRLTLSEAFSPLLRNLAKTTLGMVSPAAVAKFGATFSQNPVGTGPFKFVSLTQGTEIKLERNPDYQWAPPTATHKGPAYLDRLTFKNVPEESTRVAALQSTQVQAADFIPPQNLVALKADKTYRVLEKEMLNSNYSLYVNSARAPWNDDDMRKALQLSIDIDTLVRVIYLGTQPRAWSPLSPSIFAAHEKDLANSWKPDLKRAAQILDEKGWKPGKGGVREKDGKRLVLSFIDNQGNREKRLDLMQLMRRQLLRSGIDLVIDTQSLGAYSQKVSNGDFDIAAGSVFGDDPDLLIRYTPIGRAKSSSVKTDDAEITKWIGDARSEIDSKKRSDLYGKAESKLVDKGYVIPIYVLIYNIGTAANVQGISMDTSGMPQFQAAWLDK